MNNLNYEEISMFIQGGVTFDCCDGSRKSAIDAIYWLNKQEITSEMVKKEFDEQMKGYINEIDEMNLEHEDLNLLAASFITDWVCRSLLRENNMYYDPIKNPNGFILDENITFTLGY